MSTPAGDLSARWVVHTVGPLYAEGEDRSDVLASCYRESLAEADRLGARTVAFPAVSTGIFRWPVDDAARIAVEAVRATPTTSVRLVRFVLFTPTVLEAFERAMAADGSQRVVDPASAAADPAGAFPAG